MDGMKRFDAQAQVRPLAIAEQPEGPIPALPLAFGLSAMLWVAVLAAAQHCLAVLI